MGRQHELLGILLIGNSQHDVVTLQRHILLLSIGVVAIGLLFGSAVGLVGRGGRDASGTEAGRGRAGSGRRKLERASERARARTKSGSWRQAFNQMTEQLVEQRERLLQAERVAAWREVARRLAHELKNPLFPLQTTVENLQRAKEQNSGQFEEVFHESTGILLAEIENLKTIVGRFSEFRENAAARAGAGECERHGAQRGETFRSAIRRGGASADYARAASRRKRANDSGGLGAAASRARESGFECDGRDACRAEC